MSGFAFRPTLPSSPVTIPSVTDDPDLDHPDGNPARFPVASLFVGLWGCVLLTSAVFGLYAQRDSSAVIGLATIGAALVFFGPLLNRIVGPVKFGPTGVEGNLTAPVARNIRRSEREIRAGRVAPANDAAKQLSWLLSRSLDAAVHGFSTDEASTNPEAGPHVDVQPEASTAVIVPSNAPAVYMTEAANEVLKTLSGPPRQAFYAAITDLGDDPVIARTRAGVTYMARWVSSDLSLIYRLADKTSESEPDQYFVVAIERPGMGGPKWLQSALRS